ncbi:SMUG2 DNA glycosylase family protein [Mucilaginibacter terrenus]|uniref:SMUG2 DNA glycosylase family protein n=1 Tax=Mucilaginibacter terrenus TaxID=2482727 RepID=A0A3E2NJR7_9SPHI|nr:uracil-DNA glycosylase family protein [Mucilaginibacter terrenus]RFZ81254.1 SMUG2 DNA glycosylase family protein [Mucilaginibacter terrenus]
MSFGNRVIQFYKEVEYAGPPLPSDIRIMNPYKGDSQVARICKDFYGKYYNDERPRHLILGINPGRFGGGLTGIPFTDPKRLISECNIAYEGKLMHETSSVFIYEMINAYGGPEAFYQDLYINSLFPLALTQIGANGEEKNYNYYDSKELCNVVTPSIIENIRKQISIGCYTDVCFCFGTGKNEKFINKLNDEYHFFDRIVALEHPRFIMQYKSKSKDFYINKYLEAFAAATSSKPK